MNKQTLQILDRVALVLLTEEQSRSGDNGAILEHSEIPNDGIRRVFVGEVLSGTYTGDCTPQQIFHSINHLCVQGMQRLSGPSDVLWCFGEECLDRVLHMKSWLGNTIRHCASSYGQHVFIFPLHPRLNYEIGSWPVLRNEYSLHVFAISGRHGRVHKILNTIYDGIAQRPAGALVATYRLMERCLFRSEITALMQEVPMLLLPDGSHFQFPGIQTASIDIGNIVQVFADLARTYGYEFSHHENIGRRYIDFFKEGSSIVIDG